jgi:hypothetical protein
MPKRVNLILKRDNLTEQNDFGITVTGTKITAIREGSPADRAGLTINQQLLEVNRISTENLNLKELFELIKESTRGSEKILDLLVDDLSEVPSYQKDPLPRFVLLGTKDKNALLYDIISKNENYISLNNDNKPAWHVKEGKKNEIIEINGRNVTKMTFADVTALLKNLCIQNENIKLLVVDDTYDLFWRNLMNKET